MNKKEDPLQIQTREEDGQRIVQISGEVDLGSSPQLRTMLVELASQRPARVIVDLAGVGYMDSSGVGTMVELKRTIERNGGEVVLAALQPRVRSVFEITQLDKFFVIATDVAEARKR
ncbi:MAG: STAS domain-containing protein [Planctomycetes bacterium]|nr:STAS domain-containing protein [Planctomycetota bacterium]